MAKHPKDDIEKFELELADLMDKYNVTSISANTHRDPNNESILHYDNHPCLELCHTEIGVIHYFYPFLTSEYLRNSDEDELKRKAKNKRKKVKDRINYLKRKKQKTSQELEESESELSRIDQVLQEFKDNEQA